MAIGFFRDPAKNPHDERIRTTGEPWMTGAGEWLETAREERWGILVDLLFAIVWVTVVDLLFSALEGPTWAYYLLMLTGIAAYFAFVWNLELARAWYNSN